ncbi:MAG: porin family protein [Bacteroidales bacterium]
MRRLVLVLAAFILVAVTANAQSGFGVKAGLNFNSMSDIKIENLETSVQNKTGFHVGVVYKLKLPAGLALQPELVYTQKSSSISYAGVNKKSENKMGYLQLPVNLQWGVDLVLFRPFIQVSPYVGYMIHNKTDFFQTDYKKFQYGIGVGAGLEIWKFQLSGRYCWDLGEVGTFSWDKANPKNIEFGKNRGFELSLAIIF